MEKKKCFPDMLISNKLYSSLLEMCLFDYIILGTNLAFICLEF